MSAVADNTTTVDRCFADTYAQARALFLTEVSAAGLAVHHHLHPLRGAQREELAMDVARDGAMGADKLLIVSSACHGVEGHCGSGVQVAALRDAAWLAHARKAGVAVLYIHALNPHGFSHSRRVTHENVDLNRNFQRFDQPLPVNAAYDTLHDLLLPDQWPPDAANQAAVASWITEHGMLRYQAAVSQGQHTQSDGLFFGGTQPTWSNQTLRGVLREHGQGAKHVAWIDLHTGLGPSGVGERIWAGMNDAPAIARARQWWGNDGATPITSIYDGTSTSALLTGLMWSAIHDECPDAAYTGMALEYGTVPITQVIDALRADHWLHRARQRGQAVAEDVAANISQQMRDTFYVATTEWREQIVAQGKQGLFQAVDGLSS
jgi:hypothetical protein